jgi:hypothetical protein
VLIASRAIGYPPFEPQSYARQPSRLDFANDTKKIKIVPESIGDSRPEDKWVCISIQSVPDIKKNRRLSPEISPGYSAVILVQKQKVSRSLIFTVISTVLISTCSKFKLYNYYLWRIFFVFYKIEYIFSFVQHIIICKLVC